MRFIEVMGRLGLSGYALSRVLGTSEAVISNIRNGKNPPNVLLVQELLRKYVDIDPGWLITGRGSMFRSDRAVGSVEGNADQLLDGIVEQLDRMEGLLKRSIEAQFERNMLNDEAVSDLEKQVDRLEKGLEALRKDRRKNG